jgi:hypothetical protein
MNEILALISSEAPSVQPVLIVPFITRPSSYYHGIVRSTKTGQLTTLHASEIGASNEFTHLLVDGTTKPPPSLQIRSEPILAGNGACVEDTHSSSCHIRWAAPKQKLFRL